MTRSQKETLITRQGHPMTWARYHRYGDMVRYMEFLVYTFPDIAELITIGSTTNGLPLKLLKISSENPTDDGNHGDSKPAIWINGGIHSHEWISPTAVLYIARQLVEHYKVHQQIVDNADWYLMPVANPDGYEYSQTIDRLWSKTRSNHDNSASAFASVDLNRNFDFHWGEAGASDDPCSNNYAGPRPLSEPEARAITDFVSDKRDQLLLFISLHAYSQNWLVPWGYTNKKADDHNDMLRVVKNAITNLKRISKTEFSIDSMASFKPTSSGTIEDWAKGSVGIKYTYRVEMRDRDTYGYILPASQISATSQETFATIRSMVKSLVCKN